MSLTFKCSGKDHHHDDADGKPVIAVRFTQDNKLGSLHLYMSGVESDKYALGASYALELAAAQ